MANPSLTLTPSKIDVDHLRLPAIANFAGTALALLAVSAGLLSAKESNNLPPRLLDFSTAKEQQELQFARELHMPLPAEVANFFQSASQGDYPAMSNIVASCGAQLYAGAEASTNVPPAWLPFWQPMTEVESAFAAFTQSGTKYPLAFGDGIIQSIPVGSIYFGGSDPGRMLVTALCESSVEGRPFFTLTQNALSDNRYMDYLRDMYGKWIVLPTTNEMQKAQEDYTADLQRRVEHDQEFPTEPHQLKPGENYRMLASPSEFGEKPSARVLFGRKLSIGPALSEFVTAWADL
jgi:hypothetical protein